jgi:hypothetical protein
MEGYAGKVTYRWDSGAERFAYLAFESVELGVAEEAGLEGEVFADEEASHDSDSTGLG